MVSSSSSNVSAQCLMESQFTLMYNQDMLYVLKPPHVNSVLPENIWRMVTASLATSNDIAASAVQCNIPHKTLIVQYGRVIRLGGGITMQCHDLVNLGSDERDTYFVRVSQLQYCLSMFLTIL